MTPRPPLHLRTCLQHLRRRRGLAALAFALVCAGLIARVLFLPPVYRSHAVLQIENKRIGGLLGDLEALESSSEAETELEIMRSHRVAEAAYRRLRPGDLLVEEHYHRPFESLLRRVRGAPPACTVDVETSAEASAGEPKTFVFDFRRTPLRVELRRPDGSERTEEIPHFSRGVAFRAHGCEFKLAVDGDPAGRRFKMVLRTPVDGARWIRENVRLSEIGRRTGVVRLAYEAETPGLAQRVAAALADSYLELKVSQRREKVVGALEFLQGQIERVRQQLKKSEEALDRYRVDSGALLLSERAQWLVERMSAMELERVELELRHEETTRWLESIGTKVGLAAALRALDGADPLTAALSEQLVRLEIRRDGLRQEGVLEAHPHRARTEEEIRAARDRLESNVRRGLVAMAESIERRLAQLETTRGKFDEEARRLPVTEREAAKHLRDVTANLKIFNFLVEKEQEAKIALASTLSTARLIDRPLAPLERTSPLLTLQFVVAFLLAVVAALLAATVAEYSDRSIRTARELEEGTDLQLFASIPHVDALARSDRRVPSSALVALDDPESIVTEAYRGLRTNLRCTRLGRSIRSIAITSATPSEGKTVTLCNLAVVCAQAGERTVVVDADMRRPTIHTRFGGARTPGLSEILSGRVAWREALRSSGIDGLHSIPAGARPPDPGALLDSERLDTLIEQLREEFDWIFVDVPPVLAVADGNAVLPRLDGVLLLARCRKHSLDVARDARDRVRRSGAELLGAVFNAVDRRAMGGAYESYGGYVGYGELVEERA